jgi:hypothetical protein
MIVEFGQFLPLRAEVQFAVNLPVIPEKVSHIGVSKSDSGHSQGVL